MFSVKRQRTVSVPFIYLHQLLFSFVLYLRLLLNCAILRLTDKNKRK